MEWLSVVCTQAEIAVSMTCMLGQMGVAGVAEIVPEQPQRSLLTVYDTDDSHQRPSRLLLKMSCFGGANENQRTLAWKVGLITFNFSQSILEHTLDLMTPKLDHLFLGVVEVLLSLEQT